MYVALCAVWCSFNKYYLHIFVKRKLSNIFDTVSYMNAWSALSVFLLHLEWYKCTADASWCCFVVENYSRPLISHSHWWTVASVKWVLCVCCSVIPLCKNSISVRWRGMAKWLWHIEHFDSVAQFELNCWWAHESRRLPMGHTTDMMQLDFSVGKFVQTSGNSSQLLSAQFTPWT